MENEKEEPLYEFNLPEDPNNPRYIASRQVQPKKQEDQGTGVGSNHNEPSQRSNSHTTKSAIAKHLP
jgi:hypothetical protein